MVYNYAKKIEEMLKANGIRVLLDDDDRLRPGEKFYRWEMFGVPVRIEVGPREYRDESVTLVRRDSLERSNATIDTLIEAVNRLFDDIYQSLKNQSCKRLIDETADADNIEELRALMDQRRIVKVSWCGKPDCAFSIKDQVAGEVRGTQWKKHGELLGSCIVCGGNSMDIAYISRTY